MKKITGSLLLIVLIIMNVFTVYAQDPGEPCNNADPDATCPLDSWVIVLVVAAAIITTIYLYRRKRSALTA